MSYGERHNWTIGKVLALPVTVPFTVFLMTVVIGQAFYSAVIQPWQFRLMPKRRIPFYSNSWRMSRLESPRAWSETRCGSGRS